jgi:hypothetical protein
VGSHERRGRREGEGQARGAQRKIAAAYGYALADKDPDAILGTKDRPSELLGLSQYLDADQINVIRNNAQVERNRLDAQRARATLAR